MDENNNEEIIDETLEEKIPSLEDLKNKENISNY